MLYTYWLLVHSCAFLVFLGYKQLSKFKGVEDKTKPEPKKYERFSHVLISSYLVSRYFLSLFNEVDKENSYSSAWIIKSRNPSQGRPAFIQYAIQSVAISFCASDSLIDPLHTAL